MASLVRDNIKAKDYPMSKFLFSILKQLELKKIDWDEVARECDISKGHAARMRFSRFKSMMEDDGTNEPKPRGRPAGSISQKPVGIMKTKAKSKAIRSKGDKQGKSGKSGIPLGVAGDYEHPMVKCEPGRIKVEDPEQHTRSQPSSYSEYRGFGATFNPFELTPPPSPPRDDLWAAMDAEFKREMAELAIPENLLQFEQDFVF